MTIEEEIKDTEYYQYAQDVIKGKIVAGKLIKLACQRFINDCKRDDLIFRKDKVEHFFKFCRLFHHYKSTDTDTLNKSFILTPWQQWCFANLIGFYYKHNNKRRFNTALLCIARKNGKTALAAVFCLYMMFDESGASVGLAANSRTQASLAFDDVSKFASQIDPKQKTIKRYRNFLRVDENAAKLKVFAADSTKLDGENLSCVLIDEYHAAPDNKVYAVLRSSQTSRKNPLLLVISTVGFNLAGPMKKMYDTDCEILNGVKEDDNRFIAIYQMDEGDDWEDENNWIKHSPNLGESVSIENLRISQREAKNNPSTLNEILTKNWNIWCNTVEAWITDNYINEVTDTVDINDFIDCETYVGVDLAAVSDITAVSYLIRKEDTDTIYFKTDYYLPETMLVESPNRELYRYWHRTGQLKITNSNVTDYSFITNDLMQNYEKLSIKKIAYDQWNSTQWAIEATELGLPLEPYSQSIGNFNKPTREFERLIRSKKVVIDNNEITRWMFRNVALKSDHNGNVKPNKGAGKDKKIDGIISMIEALGIYLDTPRYTGGIFVI